MCQEGETHRVEFEGESTLIAATNLETELDKAIWRRFDTRMLYNLPDAGSRSAFLSMLVGDYAHDGQVHAEAAKLLAGSSFADMEQIMLKAKRKAIIEGRLLTASHVQNAYVEYNPVAAGQSAVSVI